MRTVLLAQDGQANSGSLGAASSQAPAFTNPHGDPLPVRPFKQGNEVFPGYSEPIAYCGRNYVSFLPQLGEDRSKLLEGFAAVVPVPLNCLNPPACRSQPQDRQNVPPSG